jgi:hypothetical protein
MYLSSVYSKIECEKLHIKFCKRAMSTNFAVLSELGRFPIHYQIIKQMIGYWHYLENLESSFLYYRRHHRTQFTTLPTPTCCTCVPTNSTFRLTICLTKKPYLKEMCQINFAVLSELGHFPIHYQIIKQMLGYWHHLENLESSFPLLKAAYNSSKKKFF